MPGSEDLHSIPEVLTRPSSQVENRPLSRGLREKADFVLGRTLSISSSLGIVFYAMSTMPGPTDQLAIARILALSWLGETIVLIPLKLISSAFQHKK